jgi:hypothetical protein
MEDIDSKILFRDLKIKTVMGKNGATEDRRRGVRKPIIGEMLWSYASAQDENISKGVMVDESESGLGILTIEPVIVGSTLRISCKNRDARYASVMWSKEEVNDICRSGLLFLEQ